MGRFNQPDTVVPQNQGVQAWDRYAYTFNNPLRYVDSDGHDPITIALLLMGVGALILSACAPDTPTPNQSEIQSFIDKQDYQGAIDKAIELYDIDTHGVEPEYDASVKSDNPNLTTLAETIPLDYDDVNGVAVGGTIQEAIGPAAFSSPDTLVGTLVHESIHVEQWQEDRLYTTLGQHALNEVEAYDYVAEHKDEFEISNDYLKATDVLRDAYFRILPTELQERVRHHDYTLP